MDDPQLHHYLSFVTFRIITDYVPYEAWWGLTRSAVSNAMIWTVWVMPLFLYEVSNQYRKIEPSRLRENLPPSDAP